MGCWCYGAGLLRKSRWYTTCRYHINSWTSCRALTTRQKSFPLVPSYTMGGNVSWYSHYRKQYEGSSKLKISLSCDPAIPLLGIYLDKTTEKDICTQMLTAALSTTVKIRKQPKHPTTDDWIEKMCYVYTVGCASVIKSETMPFAAKWIDLEIVILSDTVRKRKLSDTIYM